MGSYSELDGLEIDTPHQVEEEESEKKLASATTQLGLNTFRNRSFLLYLALLIVAIVFGEVMGFCIPLLLAPVLGSTRSVYLGGLWVAMAILPGAVFTYFLYFRNSLHLLSLNVWVVNSTMYAVLAYFVAWVAETAIVEFGAAAESFIAPPNEYLWMAAISSTVFAFAVPALVEEGAKYVIAISRPVVVPGSTHYGVMLVGFSGACAIATIENIQYTILEGFGDGDFGALKLVLMRGVMSVPLHCITGILIGGGVAFAAFDPKTSVYKRLPFILFWPIVLHGCFDAVEFLALQESQTRDNTLALWFGIAAFLLPLVIDGFGLFLALRMIGRLNYADAYFHGYGGSREVESCGEESEEENGGDIEMSAIPDNEMDKRKAEYLMGLVDGGQGDTPDIEEFV